MAPDAKKEQNIRHRERHSKPQAAAPKHEKARNSKEFRAKSVAGAEGFEPSARGFGVDVGKTLADIQQPVFRTVAPFVFLKPTPQKVLMIY